MKALWVLIVCAGFILHGTIAFSACAPVRDNFSTERLSTSKWLEKQLYKDQLTIEPDGTARLSLHAGDAACSGNCQRNEIRIANNKRCKFGDEVWYRFKFKVAGTIPEAGSVRWVIGQWKQESGGSPFLAQRFDNGIFHITVQRNADRILVTKAPGNPNARSMGPDQRGFMVHQKRIRRVSWGGIDTWPINSDVDRGPHQVFLFNGGFGKNLDTDIVVELGADPVLPDPKLDWVDMVYRVRGGVDGTGLIEIWANGVFKARVRGTIGNDDSAGPTQYFKFGLYRDIHDSFGSAHFYFDDFKRSTSREGILD